LNQFFNFNTIEDNQLFSPIILLLSRIKEIDIFFWNSSAKEKPGGTTRTAERALGGLSLLTLKTTGTNNLY
jgi:hypothetical protein